MILVDANLLIYAVMPEFDRHEAAHAWLAEVLAGPPRTALPWPSLLAYHRVVTSPRVFDRPLRGDEAWGVIEHWLALDTVWSPVPSERHAALLAGLIRQTDVTGNLIHDAHLAALALDNGLEIASTDADFARFPGVRWTNPLAP